MAVILSWKCRIFGLLSRKKPTSSWRTFCSSLRSNLRKFSVVPVWSKEVKTFGNLRVSGGNIGLHICSSDPWKDEGTSVSVSLVSDSAVDEEILSARECVKCELSGKDDEFSHIMIDVDAERMPMKYNKVCIEIPHLYNVLVNTVTSSSVIVEKIEGDVKIDTRGDCVLSQIKSGMIDVSTSGGSISSSSSLIGDVSLVTRNKGDICLHKLQGNSLKMKCDEGNVDIASLYGGSILIETESGNVNIGDAHGNIEIVSTAGDVACGSISGVLKALVNHGNFEAKVTHGGCIEAVCLNGDGILKLDDNVMCQLDLASQTMNIAADVRIAEELKQLVDGLTRLTGQTYGMGEQSITVNCPNGHVSLSKESWFVFPES